MKYQAGATSKQYSRRNQRRKAAETFNASPLEHAKQELGFVIRGKVHVKDCSCNLCKLRRDWYEHLEAHTDRWGRVDIKALTPSNLMEKKDAAS